MRFSPLVLVALFVLSHAAPASAVHVYLTPDQGYPFQTGGDPREIDLIGSGPSAGGLQTEVGPSQSTSLFNLWIDFESEVVTFLGLRLRALNGAVFTEWDASATLDATLPDDNGAFGPQIPPITVFTTSNINIDEHCSDFSGLASPPAGLPQGNCIGSGPGVALAGADPDTTTPLLIGTLTMDLSAAIPNLPLVEVVTGPLSSYIFEGQPEQGFPPGTLLEADFGAQTMLRAAAPEPQPAALLGLSVAVLLVLRARSKVFRVQW